MGTVKWNKLPTHVQRDLVEYHDFNTNKSQSETVVIVEQQTPKQVFADWLQWNGIVGYDETLFDLPALIKAAAPQQGERITAYATPAPDGSGQVVVDVEGMMVDLVTFVKAMAIQRVVQDAEAKGKFMTAIGEVWNNVQVTMAPAKGERQ